MTDPSAPSAPAAPTIGALLERRALRDSEAPALMSDGVQLNYRELHNWAVAVDAALSDAGIGSGDRVAVLSRNSAASIALYFGVARRGAILCNANIRLEGTELAPIIEDCAPALIIAPPEFAETAADLAKRFGIAQRWTIGEGSFPESPRGRVNELGSDLVAAAGLMNGQAPVSSDQPLLLVYTSGTTGRPRGAVLSHAGLYWAAASMVASHDYRPTDVCLIPVPMFHVGGMSSATFFPLLGACAIVPPAWEAGVILRTIETERVNHFFAVATMLRSLIEHPDFGARDLSSLRFIMAGGAPVPIELIKAYSERGIPVLHTYGSTETAGPATVVDPKHHLTKGHSAGLPYFHTDIRIVGDDGALMGADGIGEIQVRAPHLIMGYWRDPKATAEAFTEGWLRTGDIGCLDAEGYLYVKDRKKNVIISGGENIFPAEVEAVLIQHPSIADVAVIARPDPAWGEVPYAILVLSEGATRLSLQDIETFCTGRLARFKVPKAIKHTDRPLPRNATGKLLRHVLQKSVNGEPA